MYQPSQPSLLNYNDMPTRWHVPYERNPFFTGREHILTHIDKAFNKYQPQPVALSGLDGMGKTQIALEYAYRNQSKYSAIFWVQASSSETLTVDFEYLANFLEQPTVHKQESAVATVKLWLQRNP